MKKRPIAVTIVVLVFIAAGAAGLIYHLHEWKAAGEAHYAIVWISAVRLLAVVAGIFLLLGKNWARWLAMAWIAFHVVISAFHPIGELMIHAVLMVVFATCLFWRNANEYFRRT